MKSSKIALIQLKSMNNKEDNFKIASKLILDSCQENKLEPPGLICLPECFGFISGGTNQFESRDNSEFLDQPDGIINRFKKLALDNKVWLSLGGFHEKIKDHTENKIYNTHLIINSEGEIAANYHKMHLFDVDIPSKGVKMNESKVVEPGHEIVVVKSPVGILGLSICYDVRFPELYASLRNLGAEIILVPSAFMQKTGEAHWEPLLRARAIENQCYVLASAQTGMHHLKRNSYGHSLAIDPWGLVLKDLETKENCYSIIDINLDYLKEIRENIPISTHKKPQNYFK